MKKKIYFGNKTDRLGKIFSINEFSENQKSLQRIQKGFSLDALWVTKQVHGVSNFIIDSENVGVFLTDSEADILITDKKNVGIGVLTADCVPLLLYAPDKQVIAAVHAGWKGAVLGVAAHAVEKMVEYFSIDPMQLEVSIGPSIKVCCFEVGSDVVEAVQKTPHERLALYEWEDRVICDLVELNIQFLLSQGCRLKLIDRTQNVCTKCTPELHSYRREKEQAGRQISFIALVD